jgi:hypothetical protein
VVKLGWQVAQFELAPLWFKGNLWLSVEGFQPEVLWQVEHWSLKWTAGRMAAWQPAQLVALAAAWLKIAPAQVTPGFLWQLAQSPL